MIVDLGCGAYCRGDIGITVSFSGVCMTPFDGLRWFKHPNPQFIVADLNKGIPLKDKSVDHIIMSHILEHLYRPFETLIDCRRILKEQGILEIVIPNAKSDFYGDSVHVYTWTIGILRNLVRLLFEIMEASAIPAEPDPIGQLYLKARKRSDMRQITHWTIDCKNCNWHHELDTPGGEFLRIFRCQKCRSLNLKYGEITEVRYENR